MVICILCPSKYTSKRSNANTIAAISNFVGEYFFSVLLVALLAKATGCCSLSSPTCSNTAPKPFSQASTHKKNSLSRCGDIRTGADISTCFIVWKLPYTVHSIQTVQVALVVCLPLLELSKVY